MHIVHPGNVAETKTVREMVRTVPRRFPIQCVILVADRGLLGLENIGELTALADRGGSNFRAWLGAVKRRPDRWDMSEIANPPMVLLCSPLVYGVRRVRIL